MRRIVGFLFVAMLGAAAGPVVAEAQEDRVGEARQHAAPVQPVGLRGRDPDLEVFPCGHGVEPGGEDAVAAAQRAFTSWSTAAR